MDAGDGEFARSEIQEDNPAFGYPAKDQRVGVAAGNAHLSTILMSAALIEDERCMLLRTMRDPPAASGWPCPRGTR
jgi:hypothetical protein